MFKSDIKSQSNNRMYFIIMKELGYNFSCLMAIPVVRTVSGISKYEIFSDLHS